MKPSTRGRIRSLGVLCCTTSLLLFVICLSSSSGLSESRTAPSRPLFREVSVEVGLKFHHFTGATGEFYAPEIVGPGVALFDYDNDGDLDVYLVQGTILAPGKTLRDALFPPPAGWKEGNRLFKNLLVEKGKLEFVDVTEQAGVGHVGYGMGVAVGDYDNDGYQDLYVTNFGPNVLYHNNGNGTFREVTREANVDDPRWSSSAAPPGVIRITAPPVYIARLRHGFSGIWETGRSRMQRERQGSERPPGLDSASCAET